MSLAADRWGNFLEDFIACREEEAAARAVDGRIASAAVVVRTSSGVLMIYNRHREQWEIPGGGIEAGETPRECVVRELEEETGQTAEKLAFRGLQKMRLKPDDSHREWWVEYGAIYEGAPGEPRPFVGSDEVSRMTFWDPASEMANVSPVDRKLIECVLERAGSA